MLVWGRRISTEFKGFTFMEIGDIAYGRFVRCHDHRSKACRGVALHAGPSDTLLDCALILAAQRGRGRGRIR